MSALVTTNGTRKTQYENLSGGNLIATMNNDLGGSMSVALDTGKQGKKRVEWELMGKASPVSGAGSWSMGLTDGATTLAGAGGSAITANLGATAGKNGCMIIVRSTTTGIEPYANGAQQSSVNVAVTPAIGDRFAAEFDTTNNQVKWFHCPVSTGVWSASFWTVTLSSQIPSGDWYATSGGFKTADSIKLHLTGALQTGTPSSGFTAYDDSGGVALVIANCTSAGALSAVTLNANPQVAAANCISASIAPNVTLNVNQPLGVFTPISGAFAGNDQPGTEFAQNGGFDDTSFWSITATGGSNISGGKLQLPSAPANSFLAKQNNALPNAGRWIKVQYTISKWSGAPVVGSIRFRADTGAFGLDAPILTATAPIATSLDWSGLYNNTVPWDTEELSGDQLDMEWRINGGAWVAHTRKPLDSLTLALGQMDWNEFIAAAKSTGQTIDVRERKVRYVANTVVGTSPYSNVLTFTVP